MSRVWRFARSQDVWAILFLAAWFLLYHLPVTLGQQVFSEGDILWGNLPIRAEVTRALAQGRLPLWTPLLQAGMPLFAEGHTAALYPPNLVWHSLMPAHFAISYIILSNLIWVSIGMYFFVRACGLRVSSAMLAGLAFGACGAVTARVSHLDVLTPISWLPWLMFFQAKYWRARFKGEKAYVWFILGCFAIGLQFLAGSPAIIMLNLIVFVFCGIFAGILWADDVQLNRQSILHSVFRRWVEGLGVTGGSILLGLGVGAAQLLPTFELIAYSIRGKELGKAFFTSYSLEPFALTQLLSPFTYLGAPVADNMEFWAYLGILPLLLAVLAPILRRDMRTVFFAGLAILAIALALGGSNPLYDWLYAVPVLNRFRVPARYLFIFLFASTFLAAVGFDEIQNRLQDASKKWPVYVTMMVFLAAATLGIFALAYNCNLDFWMGAWVWLPVPLVLSSILILASGFWRRVNRQVFQSLVFGLTCMDLALFGAPFLPTLDRTTTPSDLAQAPRTVQAMDSREPVARSMVIKFPSVTPAATRATLWGGLPMAYGRAGILRGYMPFSLALQRNEDYIQQMSPAMRHLMNIRYYLLPLDIAPPETESPFDATQPENGLTLDLLSSSPNIPITPVVNLRVVSYTDQTMNLPDGFLVGQIELILENGDRRIVPMRLGIETADWAYDGLAQKFQIQHHKPAESIEFAAYLSAVGRDFKGRKYISQVQVGAPAAPLAIKAIGVQSFLPGAGLMIEHIDLIDAGGNAVSLAQLLHRDDLALVFRSHTAAMWDDHDVMPRAFVVHSAQMQTDDQILQQMQSPSFDPYHQVFLNEPPAGDTTASAVGAAGDIVTITEYKPDSVALQVSVKRAGYLVLADSWYPGWVAYVDGVTKPIARADYIFRTVYLQPGQHVVTFEYRPDSFTLGVLISGSSCVLVIGIMLIGQFRRLAQRSALEN